MASGSTLSYDQLEALWISKGGAPQLASTAAAVALAESSGWTGGPPSPTGDEGLWQINLAAWGLPPGQSDWYDPATNANEAVFIEQSATASNKSGHNEYIDGVLANFWDWAAFKSGAYKRFLQGGGTQTAGGQVGSPGGIGSIGTGGINLGGGLPTPIKSGFIIDPLVAGFWQTMIVIALCVAAVLVGGLILAGAATQNQQQSGGPTIVPVPV